MSEGRKSCQKKSLADEIISAQGIILSLENKIKICETTCTQNDLKDIIIYFGCLSTKIKNIILSLDKKNNNFLDENFINIQNAIAKIEKNFNAPEKLFTKNVIKNHVTKIKITFDKI